MTMAGSSRILAYTQLSRVTINRADVGMGEELT